MNQQGFIFLEVLVAISIISVVFIVLLGIIFLALNLSTSLQKVAQADFLAKEEIEAVRSFRDATAWVTTGLGSFGSNYGNSYPYYFTVDTSINPPKWKINSGTETIGIFARSIVFNKVSRDLTTNNIESPYNASHDDPDTKQLIVTVTYEGKTYQLVTYLTNWQKK